MHWISVEEDLPEDDGEVLVAYNSHHLYHVTVARYTPLRTRDDIKMVWVENDMLIISGEVTHWMPLPEHPVIKEKRLKKQYEEWSKEDFGFLDPDDFYD